MASKQVQRRKGTTAAHAGWVGALAEVTVDTTKMVEVVHDGSTPGGFPQASARDIAAVTAATDAKIALTVPRDSATGAAKIPKGTTSQRPVAPSPGDMRFNTTTQKFEGWTDPALGWVPIGSDSIPLFSVFWVPQRTYVPAGFVVADGQTLSRATYPDAWAGVSAGNTPNVIESTWLADNRYRAMYTVGDGSTTFRIPDYNGKSSGSLGAVFLRGDGAMSSGFAGIVQQDAVQGHFHDALSPALQFYCFSGANPGNQTVQTSAGTVSIGLATTGGLANDGTHGTPRSASESRPLNATGCWCVKLFGAVINPGAADAAQLATEVAGIKADIQNNYYRRNNTLGTVSQVSGVPTGALMESGTNANGYYAKYADGALICRQVSGQSQPTDTAAGGLYYSSTTYTFTFPASFIAVPAVVHQAINASNYLVWSASEGTRLISYFNVRTVSPSNTASSYVSYVAVGRWF